MVWQSSSFWSAAMLFSVNFWGTFLIAKLLCLRCMGINVKTQSWNANFFFLATELNQVDIPHARFQRTDQWLPVYSWLESLDKDEVVKSKDISDWLTENPEIKEHLCSRHSRYHLMHYIKKCHMKILKRREKKKGLQHTEKPTSPNAHKIVDVKEPASIPSNPLNNIPKDSDLYLAKRNEALRKFEILLELEKTLSPHFSKAQAIQK
ncbi:uncharacterized protein LOC8287019 isoform X4 [Ricinus communis]|uniref:uncharacterized protein LOC8287019 isoform X4 n=1 Tax=Ricinus communis TaxID=3988 RepID=UPI00201A3060|nr:uncharacterized protein LOC8287019 isoform X4 [Ricinus communis]